MYSSHNMFCAILIVFAFAHVSFAAIGQSCINNRCPNNEVDAYCDNGRCVCTMGFISSQDQMRCLKVATSVGVGCEEDLQCTTKLSSYATCNLDRHQCACRPDASVVLNMCEKKRLLGEICRTAQECSHIAQSSCTLDGCRCTVQYAPSANASACLPIAVSGQSQCEESIQCSEGLGDGAVCNMGSRICECKENHHFNGEHFGGKCVINKGIGDTCTTKRDCYLPVDGDEQNIDCADGACRCIDGVMPRQENQSCKGGVGRLGVMSVLWLLIISAVTTLG